MKAVYVGGISATAGTNIDLTGRISEPIYSIILARILAGHSVNEGGTATYDILATTSVTATKVDSKTITLSAAITTKDILELVYQSTTEFPVPT